jgi:hypothetical protein
VQGCVTMLAIFAAMMLFFMTRGVVVMSLKAVRTMLLLPV